VCVQLYRLSAHLVLWGLALVIDAITGQVA
jgi:hypothetical protein